MGRKKQPHYRVVVAEGSSPRDGRFVDSIGYFKPLAQPARLVLDLERVDYWLERGASPSNTVKSLISRARTGGDDTVAVGEPDAEARKQAAQEELAAKRAAEKKAIEEAEAQAKADAEAAAAVAAAEAAEAEAAAAAEAEVAEAAAAEAEAAEAETVETAEAEATETAEGGEAAEAESDAEAEADAEGDEPKAE